MRRIILTAIFFAFLTLSVVSAIDTEIHVRTIRENKVSIFVLKSGIVPPLLLNSYHISSGPTGEVSQVYTGTDTTLDIKVQVSKDGNQVYLEKFEGYTAGSPIYIQLLSENISRDYMAGASSTLPATPVNSTANVSTPATPVNSTAKVSTPANLTANQSSPSKNPTNSFMSMQIKYYILEAVVIALIIILIIMKLRSKNSSQTFHKKIALPEDKDSLKHALLQSQKKIRELESQLNSIKNQEKIKTMEMQLQAEKREMERKLEEKKRELERIKRGY